MSTLSRVADSLYWMSRYLERAEHTSRLVDVNLHTMIDQQSDDAKKRLNYLIETLESGVKPNPKAVSLEYEVIRITTFDKENFNSIYSCIAAARENARHVREQISTEMWSQINRLYLYMKNVNIDKLYKQQPHEFYVHIKESIMLFQGITDSTMSHSEGWHFIHIGRFIERTYLITRLVDMHLKRFDDAADKEVPITTYLDWVTLLKSCTAFEAYCRTHQVMLTPTKIVGYLFLDSDFPHSIRFAFEVIKRALDVVSELTETKKMGYVNRTIGKASATLDYTTAEEVLMDPHQFIKSIQDHCNAIHEVIYSTYISYPIEASA